MLDVNKLIDVLKIKLYQEYIYSNHLYDEGDSPMHKTITSEAIKTNVMPLNLPKDANILDLGCGPGYFLDEMKELGYTNLRGVTLSESDIKQCRDKGHRVEQYDISFLPQHKGYEDESVDFIFLRHALEHSPFPLFTLMEYNRLLKQNGKIYIEVPAPECERRHEFNANHYSVLGQSQLMALLDRTGFSIDSFNLLQFDINLPNSEKPEEPITMPEKYYCIVATKQKPIDIK